jgi:hypothetical protein
VSDPPEHPLIDVPTSTSINAAAPRFSRFMIDPFWFFCFWALPLG